MQVANQMETQQQAKEVVPMSPNIAPPSPHLQTINASAPDSPREITLDKIKLNEKMFCNQDIYSSLESFCASNKLNSSLFKSVFFRSAPSLTHLAPKTVQSSVVSSTTPMKSEASSVPSSPAAPRSPLIASAPKSPLIAPCSPSVNPSPSSPQVPFHNFEEKPHSNMLKRSLDSLSDLSRKNMALKRAKKNLNHEIKLNVSFDESQRGSTKMVEFECVEDCTDCLRAETRKDSAKQGVCPKCLGNKRIVRTKKTEILVPKGVTKGFKKIIKGEGHKGEDGGSGDLIIEFVVEDHPFFKRDGDNAVCSLPISVFQAVLGTKLQVPKLYGKENEKLEVNVESGTQPNEVIKLSHQGFTKLNCKKKRGDLIITIVVEVPKTTTTEQRELFERLAAIDSIMHLSKGFL
eukprot:TRINITY_DN4364_c0_g2_i2.p1 TRINITY_DN4364_c0_g2~~TRINITY_DN4364_c0_g2_i2.p1  ORF type:complete len:404 (+),score=127.90 TRINITY_DN4364_c0_g2_i2:126-1337(+)